MRCSSGPRKTTNLPESVQEQLNRYALAAAGAGMLALSHAAEAKIVYTPANVRIYGNITYALTFNQKTDFIILASGYLSTHAHGWSRLAVHPRGHNGVQGSGDDAYALAFGAVIGPKKNFTGTSMEYCVWADTYACVGNWYQLSGPRYLGLKFYISRKAHYGWARLTLNSRKATLTGFAYETIPGMSIKAGQTKDPAGRKDEGIFDSDAFPIEPRPDIPRPASLGVLALGSPGPSIWRREETIELTK
jgi:hypothetical protein